MATPTPGTVSVAANAVSISGGRSAIPGNPYVFGVISRIANVDRMVSFSIAFGGGSAYDRFSQGNVVLSGTNVTIGFRCDNGNVSRALQQTSYTLLVDGQEHATANVAVGATTGSFNLVLGPISEGWHVFDIIVGPNETCRPWGFYVKKSASPPPQPWMPVTTGTYEIAFQRDKTGLAYTQFQLAKVPSVVKPTHVPFDPRLLSDRQPFTALLNTTGMIAYQLVPSKFGDRHYPAVDENGVMMTYSYQDYFYEEYLTKRPKMRLLDGPRGEGTIKFATHLQISLRPGSRKIYFSDGWRVGVISEDGSVRTLAGWRHKNPAPHWQNPGVGGLSNTVWGVNTEPQMDLVGDWSSVPPERHGFYEPWGIAWDEDTLGIDTNAAPVGEDPPEQPHDTGPVLFVSDTHNNRIVKMQFLPNARTAAVCTEFITGLGDPWAIVWRAGKLYVTERKNHRISVWDSTTGAFIKHIVSNPVAMSGVSESRFTFATNNPATGTPYTLAQRQAAPVVGPEGLYALGDWLYYGSSAMRCIKRVNLITEVVEFYLQLDAATAQSTLGLSAAQTFFFPYPDDNSHFVNFSVSDGTFGPVGTVAMSTWSNKQYGTPVLMLPNNQIWDYVSGTTAAGQGLGGLTYGSATAIGKGILVFSGSEEGLMVLAQRGPMDPVLASPYGSGGPIGTGGKEWKIAGYHLSHGQNGYGHFGLPIPWGTSTAMDTYLRANLHTRVPGWRKSMVKNVWAPLPMSSVSNEAPGRLAFSGAALQDTPTAAVLWMGPGGGHNDNSDNSVKSLDLLAETPTWLTRNVATPTAQRVMNASYYADGKPCARHTYSSIHFSMRWNRLLTMGVFASYGSGNFYSPKVDAFNPATNTWEAAGSFPDASAGYSCMDEHGDVWALANVSGVIARGLVKWDRNSRTQGTVTDFGTSAGGPISYDHKREQLFSLSWGNGEDKFGTEIRAFVYRNLYNPLSPDAPTVPTREAVTLTSIGGALEQFALDKTEYGGMDYDRVNDAFYFYDGRNVDGINRRGRVYVIKPGNGTTWEISMASVTGVPPHVLGAGVNSRFRYVAALNGFVAYLSGSEPVWFLPTSDLT